ncbi:MAG: hypothetical protein JJE55_06950 [Flavobacteriaceae bacterium]|nr:hypothetical protein [Flavobacteriaceae bacterium]
MLKFIFLFAYTQIKIIFGKQINHKSWRQQHNTATIIMTTSIIISGQISGNHTLHNAICTYESETKKLNFNNYEIIFPTKGKAVKALSEAFQTLKNDEVDYYKQGGISYVRGSFLSYDASNAKINE